MPPARIGYLPPITAALTLTLAVLAPRAHGAPPTPHAAAAPAGAVAAIAPDFERDDLDGQRRQLRSYRGKLVLLSFWATWCEPCRLEAPRFSHWQQQYGPRGLQVLGISMDDTAAPAVEFVHQLNLAYPVMLGDAELAERFGGVLGLPLAFLIDPRGRIIARYRGEPDLARMEAEIRAALPQP